jgi:glutathione-independent formaldehyde dehydrogenase
MIDERLAQAKSFGCEIIDLKQDGEMADKIEAIVGEREVDAFVDCVGFEAHACGCNHQQEAPATVLNSAMQMTRAGGQIGIPGLYVTDDPGAVDEAAKVGALSMRFGLGWAKSHSFHTGQCPVMKYHRALMQAILFDKVHVANAVNVQLISLDEAPKGYADFDGGAATKFVIDPHKNVA